MVPNSCLRSLLCWARSWPMRDVASSSFISKDFATTKIESKYNCEFVMQCHFLLQLVGELPENIENFLGEEPGIKSTRYTKWAFTLSPGDALYKVSRLRLYKIRELKYYRKISNIRRTKSQNLNDSRLVLQLSVPNPLKPGVKSRMKM